MIIVEDKTTSDDETVMADIDVRSTYNVEDSVSIFKIWNYKNSDLQEISRSKLKGVFSLKSVKILLKHFLKQAISS